MSAKNNDNTKRKVVVEMTSCLQCGKCVNNSDYRFVCTGTTNNTKIADYDKDLARQNQVVPIPEWCSLLDTTIK